MEPTDASQINSGGPAGFLRVDHEHTLADLSGNRQYVTAGNVAVNDRTIAVPASPARAGGG